MTVQSVGQVPVSIHLKTTIQQDQENETYELYLSGHYYQKGNAMYLKYDEVVEEGTVHTIVKITENEALILRSGALKMRLSFLLHKEQNGSYESPYGVFLLTTETKALEHVREGKNEGSFILKYTMYMNETISGQYEMTIHYKEAVEKQ